MILVTGPTGDLGPYVVQALLSAGAQFRIVVRDPEKAEFDPEIEVVAGDLADPGSLGAAMAGIERVFLLAPSFLVPTIDPSVAQAAKEAGVRQIVKVSGVGAETGTPDLSSQWHIGGERAIRESGLEWTFLRVGEFMSNALHWSWGIKAEGVVREPYGDVEQAVIDPRDIAAVAATVLTTDGHVGKAYPLTGPELFSARQRAAVVGEILGREIRFEELDEAQARSHWAGMGAPEPLIEAVMQVLRGERGPWAVPYPSVQEVLGREPGTFRQFIRDHAAIFA